MRHQIIGLAFNCSSIFCLLLIEFCNQFIVSATQFSDLPIKTVNFNLMIGFDLVDSRLGCIVVSREPVQLGTQISNFAIKFGCVCFKCIA